MPQDPNPPSVVDQAVSRALRESLERIQRTSEELQQAVGTQAGDIPKDVAHLGKRSVLDGLGLALAGAASQTGEITRKYLKALGFAAEAGSTVLKRILAASQRFERWQRGGARRSHSYVA